MKAVKPFLLGLTTLIFMAETAFSETGQTNIEKSEVKAAATVLLVYEATPFKKALIDEMQSILKKRDISTVVVEYAEGALEKRKALDFDGVFISIAGAKAVVKPWAKDWIEKNAQAKDRIILHVTQTRNWKVITDVDAVTSASSKNEVSDLAAQYAERIMKIPGFPVK